MESSQDALDVGALSNSPHMADQSCIVKLVLDVLILNNAICARKVPKNGTALKRSKTLI
jgi:hypothetical protein